MEMALRLGYAVVPVDRLRRELALPGDRESRESVGEFVF